MSMRCRMAVAAAVVGLLAGPAEAQFTSGQVVVLRVGGDGLYNPGVSPLGSVATAVFLDQFGPAGGQAAPSFTVSVPTSAANNSGSGLEISGSATTEGQITRAANGQSLTIAGYNAQIDSPGVSSSAATTVNRIVGRVDAGGAVTFPVAGITTYSGGSFRGAVTDGTNYWGAGANSGTVVFQASPAAGLGTTVQSSTTNTRIVNVQNNQLYFSTGSGTIGLYQVGTGTPTGASTATLLFATGTGSSPYGFAISPTGTTAYVADDRSSTNGGGIQRWDNSGGTWGLTYTLSLGSGTGGGARGLTVDFGGPNPVLFASTTEASANRLVTVTDVGTGSAFTTLATAPANTAFRGVAFAPTPVPEPASGLALSAAGVGLGGLARRVSRRARG